MSILTWILLIQLDFDHKIRSFGKRIIEKESSVPCGSDMQPDWPLEYEQWGCVWAERAGQGTWIAMECISIGTNSEEVEYLCTETLWNKAGSRNKTLSPLKSAAEANALHFLCAYCSRAKLSQCCSISTFCHSHFLTDCLCSLTLFIWAHRTGCIVLQGHSGKSWERVCFCKDAKVTSMPKLHWLEDAAAHAILGLNPLILAPKRIKRFFFFSNQWKG